MLPLDEVYPRLNAGLPHYFFPKSGKNFLVKAIEQLL